jgi:phosphohistidine phosphatase
MNHMAKTLFIVRHGKARQKESGEKDQDRMLEAEGLRQSSRLGTYLYNKNTDISAIICSHAKRAQQTAEQISDQLNFDLSKITVDEDLYEASVRIILDKVAEFNNEWSEVIIVGHNPVVSYFVEYVTGHHFDGMEPGSVVKIACNVDNWLEISQESSSFEYYASPEDY